MPTPASNGDEPPRRSLPPDAVGLPPPRPRPSTARLLLIALASIIVTALLFRLVVELARRLLAA
jgi:hypothetical protein